jgi:hypothetical protein
LFLTSAYKLFKHELTVEHPELLGARLRSYSTAMDRWQENTEFGILSYIILTLP